MTSTKAFVFNTTGFGQGDGPVAAQFYEHVFDLNKWQFGTRQYSSCGGYGPVYNYSCASAADMRSGGCVLFTQQTLAIPYAISCTNPVALVTNKYTNINLNEARPSWYRDGTPYFDSEWNYLYGEKTQNESNCTQVGFALPLPGGGPWGPYDSFTDHCEHDPGPQGHHCVNFAYNHTCNLSAGDNRCYNESLYTLSQESAVPVQTLCTMLNLTNCSNISVLVSVPIPNSQPGSPTPAPPGPAPTPTPPAPGPTPAPPGPAPTPVPGGQCTGCIGGSKGECKAASNVCFPATAGACPAGTTHC
jgi:hypothetical protein